MSLADTAKLLASLDLDNRRFNTGVDKSMGKLNQLGVKGVAIGSALGAGLERLAEAGVRKLGNAITGGIDSLTSLENATSQVDGAIKQMGLTGKVTSAQIADWANQIEANIGAAFDDKDITAATANLLRFGKLTPQNLKPAMQVMTDLAAKTGSVDSASSLLGKALADPAKAAGKLARVGVVLTDAQQKQITKMVKAGKVAQAQKVLLDALAKTTAGAAAATQGPFARSQAVLRDVVEDAQRALATGLLPVIMEVRDELSKELAKPETLARIKRFGEDLAGGFRDLVGFVKQIPWDQVGSVLKGAADFGTGLARAFTSLPTEAKGLILGLAALNKLSGGAVINVGVDLLKGAGGTLFQQFLGKGSPANPMFVVPVGGGLGSGIAGAAGAAGLGGRLGNIFKIVLPLAIGWEVGQAIGEAISPWLRTLPTPTKTGGTFGGKSIAQIAVGARTGGLSPDERQALNDQARKLDAQRQALDKIRDRNEANRIALVTAGQSDTSRIVAAIQAGMKLALTVKVSAGGNVAYQSATFLSRASRLESKGIY